MKAIVCGKCFDFRALRETGPVECACGNVQGWWINPSAGVAKVYAKDRDRAKIMGIHNGLLTRAFEVYDYAPSKWREIHDELTAGAEGYVFHREMRNCPVAIVRVGGTNDVSWSDHPYGLAPPDCATAEPAP